MRHSSLVVALIATLAACTQAPPKVEPPQPKPPLAAVQPYEVQSPNGVRVDNYYWLRDDRRTNPSVLEYLKAENDYYAAMTARTKPLEETLYREIVARIKEDDSTVPAKKGHYVYYQRFETGKEYPIYARKPGGESGAEQVMLDGNALAAGHGFFQIGRFEVSPNERLIAWGDDTVGRRQFVIHFKDLSTGQTLVDTIPATPSSFAWADDNKTLFYIENDPLTLLTVRVKRHELGTPTSRDALVYEERDHSYYLELRRSGDEKYVVLDEHSTTSDELRFLPAAQPKAKFRVFAPREHDLLYGADHIAHRWIVRSDWQAKNYRVLEVDDAAVGDKKRWKEIVPTKRDALIEDIQLFRDYLVVSERADANERLRIKPWKGGGETTVEFPEPAYRARVDQNLEQDTNVLRYTYTSLTTPTTVYDLDMKSGQRTLRKREPVEGGFDPAQYATERVLVPARDGAKIPVSLLYRKDFKRDGTAPLYQYAYGSYGSSAPASFASPRLSLVDRGFVYALAHIRGGQDMGRSWYDDGKLLKKTNTFDDFVDVTEYLVKEHYVAKDKTFAMGGSAGGLLMGAIANRAPQDYRGIIAHVPFVDVVTTMLDESIPLTTNEFDEWGNPKVTAFYEAMLAYSPYDNVKAQAYPAMLVTTGLWDSQVQYWEPAKWVAKLRATKTDKNPLLFKINMEAGHGGKSGRFERYRETAEEYAFVLDQAGMK